MTQQLEEFFNLSPLDEAVAPVITKEQIMLEARSVYSALTTAEKVDHALPTVIGLEKHDQEMDHISTRALRTFEDLITLGNNVPDMHAGKVYEVAGQMLKTALEANNSKADKKMRMIELQLKKIRIEQIDVEMGNTARPGSGTDFDRNELLKHLVSNRQG